MTNHAGARTQQHAARHDQTLVNAAVSGERSRRQSGISVPVVSGLATLVFTNVGPPRVFESRKVRTAVVTVPRGYVSVAAM